MSDNLSRRQLFKGTALAAAGLALGGTTVGSADAAAPMQPDDARFGVVTGAGSPGSVVVQLDSSPAGASLGADAAGALSARSTIRHRSLGEGDRVVVTRDAKGALVVTALFMSLTGTIERRAGRELTVQGRRCFIDELSAVHDGSGERNLLSSIGPDGLKVGQSVGLLCVENSRSAALTVQTIYTA